MNLFMEKKQHSFIKCLLSLILFITVIALFNFGMDALNKQSLEQQQTNLENAIERSINQYYVLVGHYPENIDILKKEYGLSYNEKIFFVDYQTLGENISPDVVVIRKGNS